MLKISSPAFSRQLARLEAALGTDVVKRSSSDGRRFELTNAGEALVTATRDAMNELLMLSGAVRRAKELRSDVRRNHAYTLRD
jgi:DNA-binding transcriptional LysR family regulator